MQKLIFGCGYLGRRVAERWRRAGHEVFVVTRSPQRAEMFATDGYRPIVADVAAGRALENLPVADTVLFSLGYDRESGRSIGEVYTAAMRSALDALPAATGRFIYTSSTGVYGQSAGERIDEDSPCESKREGGRACLEAERILMERALGRRAIVLRLAGLYGPARVPYIDEIRRGRPIGAPQEGWLNLIHVDDAASIILAAEARGAPPRTFVVSDGHPVERHQYYRELAQRLGAPPPVFAPPASDSPAARRSAGNKRVDNHRMLAELTVTLAYRSYREGLAAIVAKTRGEADESSPR